MQDDSLDAFEQQLKSLRGSPPPSQLRATVLSDIHRELRAARFDRWMMRIAAAVLAVGIAMNVTPVLRSHFVTREVIAKNSPPKSLTQVAAAVAEATDEQTGRRFAHQLAAVAGWTIGHEEAAAIDAAVKQKPSQELSRGKDG